MSDDSIVVPPVTPPVTPPATPPADAAPAASSPNEEAKFRRLFEAEQAKRTAAEAELQKRKDAELSELEREKAKATAAEERANKLEAEKQRRAIADEFKLDADAMELLGDGEPDILRAKAQKLAAMVTRAPAAAGTVTQPPGAVTPSLDERITAAENSGNAILSITLKRERAAVTR